jgi:iron complex transport system substrate-binding protein
MLRLLTLFLLSFLSFVSAAADKPQLIASMSLCSDELVLLLTDTDNILSLSYLVQDPQYTSLNAESAYDLSNIYLNHGQAEEIIALMPDLILSSRFSSTTANTLLQSQGYSVTSLGFPGTLEQAYQQIEEVAALLNEEQRGRELIQQIQNGINDVQSATMSSENISAVFYANNGFSFGSNTLRHDFLESIGINNMAAEQGLVGSGKISLELLIAEQPDFLLIDNASNNDEKLAQALLHHPVIARYFPPEKIIVLPSTLFQCAGPRLIEAYEIMARALSEA